MSPRILVLLSSLSFATSCTDDPLAAETSALQGRWVSAGCEDVGGGYFLIRRFSFANTHWEVDGSIYHDAACTTPAFDYFDGGEVDVLGPSVLVTGAYEANFGETVKTLTMRDPAIAGYVSSQPEGTCCTSAIERRPMICAVRDRRCSPPPRSCGSCRLPSWNGMMSACCSRCFARVTCTTLGARSA